MSLHEAILNIDSLGLADSEQKELLEVFGFEFKQRKNYDEYNAVNKEVKALVTIDDVMLLADHFTVTVSDGNFYIE